MTIEEFQKMDLRVAKVIKAEKIEGSEKLMKLQINLGDEERQVVAGISKVYEPEQLVGKEIIIVANLEPRRLLGLESNGMLLAAHDENGEPVLLIPEKEVQAGVKVA
jgi:methionine--tRNA ligase beta chain